MNDKQQNIYSALNFHNCEQNKKLPQKQKEFNNLGGFADGFLSFYLPTNSGFMSSMYNSLYPKNHSFFIPNVPTVTLGVNYGVVAYFFKKAQGKDDVRAIGESALEFVSSWQIGNFGGYLGTKAGISIASRILAGSATGATIGTSFPIVGTIIGAVAGAFIAGFAEDWYFGEGVFEDKDKKQKLDEQQAQDKLCEIYTNKLNLIKDYLLRNNYIELRVLTESESEELCKHLSNPNESYFKSILIMQSFPKYLDKDKPFYESLRQDTKETKKIKITPIKDAILITIEFDKCFDTSKGEVIKNKQVYIYNEKFQRVVAKGNIDSKGYLKVQNVSVDKKYTIDKMSFIVDRDNFSEDNFDISIRQYAPIINVQKYHKQTKKLTSPKLSFSFNAPQKELQCNYKVESLEIHKYQNHITIILQTNTKDIGYKRYINLAYMAFDLADIHLVFCIMPL